MKCTQADFSADQKKPAQNLVRLFTKINLAKTKMIFVSLCKIFTQILVVYLFLPAEFRDDFFVSKKVSRDS
jgi:hypothetical protein